MTSMSEAWDALSAVAYANLPEHLTPLVPPAQGHEGPTESFIDAFYYPIHPTGATTCATHVDPGIVTVIADDSPGLEVCNVQGEWETVQLGNTEVALVIG